MSVRLDVTSTEDAEAAVARTIEQFGRIDTLICNAGYGLVRRVDDMTEAEFRYQLNEDAMATEKLAEGIRAFAVDAGKLDAMIRAL